jgi:hypothetical protein
MPLAYSDIVNVLLNSEGVISLVNVTIANIYGTNDERVYSDVSFNVAGNTYQEMVVPPPGGMFEMKYPDDDIVASVR